MAATTTIERRSRKLSPNEIAARKRAAAVAELQRNGIAPPDDKPARCIHDALAVGVYEEPMAPLPPDRQVRSKPDAVEIPKSEIRNFTPLTERDANRFGDAYSESVWGKDIQSHDWPEGDVRWTLTPAQLRKLNPQTIAAMNRKRGKH